MPETNDNAAKIALSQDSRDSLNATTQEAFADAEYLDSLFDEPQNVNVPPSRRRAIPQTTNRIRQKPRSKPSRSRSSAAFAWLTLGLTATLLAFLYLNAIRADREVAKRGPNASEITKNVNASPTQEQRAPKKEDVAENVPDLSRQKNATHVIGVELFPDDYLKNVVDSPNPTPPGSPPIEIQNSEAYRNLVAKVIRRLKEESRKKPRTPRPSDLPEIGSKVPKQAVRSIPTTATKTVAGVSATPMDVAPLSVANVPTQTATIDNTVKANVPTSSYTEKPAAKTTKKYVDKPIPIEDVKIGDRTVGSNPLGSEGLDEEVFYKIPHYVYQLRFNDEDGSEWRVNLLRPYNWLAISPIRIRDGFDGRLLNDNDLLFDECFPILPFPQSYYLDVWLESEEIGFQGWANVVAVDQTITIKPGKGNLVTGTFKHLATEVYDLYIEGQEKPIGCTKTHPFWSVDRQDFVTVDELYQNERVQCLNGDVRRAIDLQRRPKPETVYNLEIFNEHVYCVTNDGILVHNHCNDIPKDAEKFMRYVSEEELISMGIEKLGNKIKGERFYLGQYGLVFKGKEKYKNIAELNASVFQNHLGNRKEYGFRITIYAKKGTREQLNKWRHSFIGEDPSVITQIGHDGSYGIHRDILEKFNNFIIGISILKIK